MQGLGLGSQHGMCGDGGGDGSTYVGIDAMDVATNDSVDLDFDQLVDLPQPPQDNNQAAAWFDTDL